MATTVETGDDRALFGFEHQKSWDRNEGRRFGSYQVMEVKDEQKWQRSSPGSQAKSEGQ